MPREKVMNMLISQYAWLVLSLYPGSGKMGKMQHDIYCTGMHQHFWDVL